MEFGSHIKGSCKVLYKVAYVWGIKYLKLGTNTIPKICSCNFVCILFSYDFSATGKICCSRHAMFLVFIHLWWFPSMDHRLDIQ